MSFVGLWETQQAIYQTLIGSSQITSLLNQGAQSIFDAAPHNAAFPYLTIGEIQMKPHDTMSELGQEITVLLHIWSKYQGHKELHEILDATYQAVHKNEFILPGHTVVLSQHVKTETSAKKDGQTKEAVFQFKLFVE